HEVVDHRTWVFLGDGCLMEGVSHEAASLAGTWKLNKLVAFWDDNGISIDGDVQGWFTEDTPARFEAYGWHVVRGVDGHDARAIDDAIARACCVGDQPTLVCCRTIIGKGSPSKAGPHHCHGAPLGRAEILAAREALAWHHGPFEIPPDVRRAWDAREAGTRAEADWQAQMADYAVAYPQLAQELRRRIGGQLPDNFATHADTLLRETSHAAQPLAGRKASQDMIAAFAGVLPEMIGGSADLSGSNLTSWSQARNLQSDGDGNYVRYGVREFGMIAIMNGLALHGACVRSAAPS